MLVGDYIYVLTIVIAAAVICVITGQPSGRKAGCERVPALLSLLIHG